MRWLPDSNSLIYEYKIYKRSKGKLKIIVPVKVVSYDGSNERIIWDGIKRIQIVSILENGNIGLVINNYNNTIIKDAKGNFAQLSGEKNKEKIVYQENEQIWIMNADGSSNKQITFDNDIRYVSAKLSPDKTKILTSCIINKLGTSLKIMDIYGANIVNLPTTGADFGRWSPDGKYILYGISRGDHKTTEAELYVIKSNGTGNTQLTNTPDELEMSANWSPDGKKIAYVSDVSGQIFVADIIKENDEE